MQRWGLAGPLLVPWGQLDAESSLKTLRAYKDLGGPHQSQLMVFNVKKLFNDSVDLRLRWRGKKSDASGMSSRSCRFRLLTNSFLQQTGQHQHLPEPIVLDNLKSTHSEPVLFLPRASASFYYHGVGRFVKFWWWQCWLAARFTV